MLISIVIPIHCEEKNIQPLFKKLESVVSSLPELTWQFIFVNDGSTDNSILVLRQLAHSDARVKVVDLSKNFGKEIALTAGVHMAYSDAVICMDADLQHPPDLIPELVAEWKKGADIVATVRKSVGGQPILRRIGSHLYYWLMSQISGLDMVSQTTDFRLLDKKVVDEFRKVTERERMFRGIIDWMGFKKVYVEFHAGAREEDVSSFSYLKLWRFAVGSITAFSLWPLRLTGYLGIFITSTSGLLLCWMLGNYVFDTKVFTPLAIVVVANTFFIGVVLMAIGLVALYIGTIHTEVINRPLYIIREKLNFQESGIQKTSVQASNWGADHL